MLPPTDCAVVLAGVGALDGDRPTQVLTADAAAADPAAADPAPSAATSDGNSTTPLTIVYNDYSWKSNST